MVENGMRISSSFDSAMDFDEIEVTGTEDPETPVIYPTISVTEDPFMIRSLSPDMQYGYMSQDSLTFQQRGRPLSVSEKRNFRYKPPPRSQTMGDSSKYKKKVEHPHISIKVSPQLNKKRMSFLYKPQGADDVKSRSQSLISNSSFQSALYDNFLTPFARVLVYMKHVKDNLHALETNVSFDKNVNNNSVEVNNRMQVQNLMLLHSCIQDMEDCMEIVESLESGKSIGESASDKFRQILQMELQTMGTSPANARVAEWVVSEFVEQDNDMNNFVSNTFELDSNMFQVCPLEKPRKMSGLANSISAPSIDNFKRPTSIPKQMSNKSDIRHNTELLTFLRSNINDWDINIFKVNTLADGYPLAATTYVILESHDLFKKCKIDETTFINYIAEVENAYRDNPYHNGIHAADVVFNANYLLSCETFQGALQDWMILGLIIAAAIHDCDHPGRNNKFLINTKNDLALTYNDESVLENHHCATGFKLLKESKNNIFANFNSKAYGMTRRLIIDLVLATDMSKHLVIIGKLKTTIESFKFKESEELELSSSHFSDILHALLHCADLANPAKPLEIAIQWSRNIEEECYQQGDEERNMGLEISHMCDRRNPIFEKNQFTFLMFVALPLWESWSELVYPHATIMLDHLSSNKEYWESVQPVSPEVEQEFKKIEDDN
ncbi:CAMP-specific 3',5'-cyclic phosphodiesterase 4D-like isoform X3 [Oopsacas minuta]|uniref:3',5'-cyclic-AMP phosphodiesterase n=1 Tax=Oopsacas minuta TaxID=111878 RepID=A0AAV7K1N1_9METZ|nr:CAMP-specific 3',5'-cyclic phosphodiesterase 4D-like isoform X3 [Oopsacas minuta]